MLNDPEIDELDESGGRQAQSLYKGSKWRNKVVKRAFDRGRLIAAWLRITVLPQYGWRALLCMVLITGGRLADAASFIVGTHLLTRALSQAEGAAAGFQAGLTLAAVAMAGILAVASVLGYLGSLLATRLVLDYEKTSVIDGFAVVRDQRSRGLPLTQTEENILARQAPYMMSRAVLYIINACTAVALMITGLTACFGIFPALTVLVLGSLLLVSPLYVLAAIHSTNIGHSVRVNGPLYAETNRKLREKWLPSERLDRAKLAEELMSDSRYDAYRAAYHGRLSLPARNHLLSSLTLAFVVGLSFIWIAREVEFSPKALASIVSYLVSLRLFAHGLAGIFQGLQSINTHLPFFLPFLMRDPRFAKLHQ